MAEQVTQEEQGPSEFGRWLYDTREKVGLDVAALADKSGVSIPQIYNIESGRSQNPQPKTRKKLTDALGKEPGEKIVAATESAARIEDLGELVDFDPHDETDMPDEAGVYVFYDISDRPVYVGQTNNIRRRIREDHITRFWYKAPIVQSASYIKIEDKVLRKNIEKVMIKFLKSNAVINKQYVDRSE